MKTGRGPRTHAVQAFLTDEEFERFTAARARTDRTVASFIRVAIFNAIRAEEAREEAREPIPIGEK